MEVSEIDAKISLFPAVEKQVIVAGTKSRNGTHTIAFAVVLSLTFYVIRDLEYPRLPGLVGMNNFDNVLVELRESMR